MEQFQGRRREVAGERRERTRKRGNGKFLGWRKRARKRGNELGMKNVGEIRRIEGMHARLRLEENGREIAGEIASYGGKERVRIKATKRERIIHSQGERRGDTAHEMKMAEGGGREDDLFGERRGRRTREGEAKQEG